MMQFLCLGIGMAFSCNPMDIAIPVVFKENRAFASGLSFLGCMIGNAIGPYTAELFLEHYGLRGALMLEAALFLQRLPSSLFIRCPADIENESAKPQCKGLLSFSMFKNRRFTLFCLATFFQRFYMDSFVTHMPSFAVASGCTRKAAAMFPTSIFITCIITTLLMSFGANLVSPAHRMCLFVVACAIAVFSVILLLCIQGYAGAMMASVLCGVNIGK